jgi:hypothetical protein
MQYFRKWSEVWTIVEPEEWKKKLLLDIQPKLYESKFRIHKKMQDLLTIKAELIQEIDFLGNFVKNDILPKFWPNDIAKTLLWVESVFILSTLIFLETIRKRNK